MKQESVDLMNESIVYEVDKKGIALVHINVPESRTNLVDMHFIDRLFLVIQGIREDVDVKAVIFVSDKQDSYVDSVDTGLLKSLKSIRESDQFCRRMQALTQAIEDIEVPTAAAIHGEMRGVGAEISLACDFRVATLSPNTTISFPHVHNGLVPFCGGTQRLPRIVGLNSALDLLTTGRLVQSVEAHELHLVHAVVNRRELLSTAYELVQKSEHQKSPSIFNTIIQSAKSMDIGNLVNWVHIPYSIDTILDQTMMGRWYTALTHRLSIDAKRRSKYKAIPLIIECCLKAFSGNRKLGMDFERDCFNRLMQERITRNLIFLSNLRTDFFEQEQLRYLKTAASHTIERCVILGAGPYGGAIAAMCAAAGLKVRLKDRTVQNLSLGLESADKWLDSQVKAGNVSQSEAGRRLNNISTTLDYSGLWHADLVIEALPENLELKTSVLNEIAEVLPEHTLVATTTAILPFHNLSTASKRSDRFIGLHFIPPTERVPTVEVIKNIKTSGETLERILRFVHSIGKIPFAMNDSPGYLINRVLAPFLIEAALLIEEGVPPDVIEDQMLEFGMDAGPLRILDEIGIDQAYSIGQILFFQFGERFRLPRLMKILMNDKRFGRRERKGFYVYSAEGKAESLDPQLGKLFKPYIRRKDSIDEQTVLKRLLYMFLNESARCVTEQIVSPALHLDLAFVFAKLFPAIHGGPLRYIDSMGCDQLVREMDRFAGLFGERFEPCPILTEYSVKKLKFYHS